MVGGSSSTNGSGGSASAAVAMANSAIENARRAAASSRQSRKSSGYNSSSNLGASSKSSGRYKSSSNLGASKSSGADSSNFDLINNDNAYHVIATLVTDRLLPKLQAHSTYYTLSSDDRAFFQKMLPYSVRRKFVDALRYRLQRMKSRNGRGNDNSALDNLTKQCQMLGLDQEKVNALLDLSNNTGVKYAVSNENQEDIPITSSFENRPYAHANDYTATTQQPSVYDGGNMTSSPMAYPSNNGYASPSVRDMEATAESLARQQIMAEIDETKFLMHGSATPEAKLFWQRHMDELNGRLVSLNMQEQAQSPRGGSGFESGGYDVRPQVESYGFSGNQAANNYYEEDPMPVNSPASPTTLIQGPSCEVVAPSDLPGGYMFEAELPGRKKFVATVPSGGVTKGQKFLSTMKELETIEIPITMGGWNDDVWSCFSAGIFHPLLWNGIFFPCIALGQIMTRAELDWQARPTNKIVSSLSCTNMTVFLCFWIIMNGSAALMGMVRWQRGQDLAADFYAPIIGLNLLFLFYLQKLVKDTREAIREKYQIPETTCIGCEDFLCSTICMSCTICQMGRHTADFNTFNGTCCTRTGLPAQVELASTGIYEDSYRNMVNA